jgi:hypothetical protein
MLTREDVESYLLRMELEYEEVQPGLFLVGTTAGDAPLVISYSPPVLVFRLKVMAVPAEEDRCGDLFRRLLELNATDLVHAAYGLDGTDIILTESLELENLDYNEIQATVDSFQLAVATHAEILARFRN